MSDDGLTEATAAWKALGPITLISVNFTARSIEALEAAAEQCGDSRTDTINRAVQLYATVIKCHDEGDGWATLSIPDAPGKPCHIEINNPPRRVRPWWRFW